MGCTSNVTADRVLLQEMVPLGTLVSEIEVLGQKFDVTVRTGGGIDLFAIDMDACTRWLKRVDKKLDGHPLNMQRGPFDREVLLRDEWRDCIRLEPISLIELVVPWANLDTATYHFEPKTTEAMIEAAGPGNSFHTFFAAQVVAILHRAFELAAYDEFESRLFEVAERKIKDIHRAHVLLQRLKEIMTSLNKRISNVQPGSEPSPAADRAKKILTSLWYYHDNLDRKLNPSSQPKTRGELGSVGLGISMGGPRSRGSRNANQRGRGRDHQSQARRNVYRRI